MSQGQPYLQPPQSKFAQAFPGPEIVSRLSTKLGWGQGERLAQRGGLLVGDGDE